MQRAVRVGNKGVLSEIANPYRPGEPVADAAMLFGRQDAADWLERQIRSNVRVLVLSALPLIGKTSFIRHVGALQNLEAVNLLISLSAITVSLPPADKTGERRGRERPEKKEERKSINTVIQLVIDQLLPQLNEFNLVPPGSGEDSPAQTVSLLYELMAQLDNRLGPEQRLVLYIDDLHALLTEDMALVAGFLTAMMPLLDECPRLHLVFTVNQEKLRRIKHPLLDGTPTYNLSPLAPDASINMITLPVKSILRFDYGVTRRIAEVNSHHPYYLCLFCHTLLNRQVHDGWVNQRDFDAALAEILASPIEPFSEIWDQASWAERAVLSGMAAIQGTHGPMTRQEVIRYLQRQHSGVVPEVVIESLEVLAERGVLVPMGAVSYRFHVELFRFWLREYSRPAELLKEVNWSRLSAQPKPTGARSPQTKKRAAKKSRHTLLWSVVILLIGLLCLVVTGGVLAAQFLDLPLFVTTGPAPAPAEAVAPLADAAATDNPTPAASPEPTPTVTPTPPLVVARALPSIVYMGRDVDQSWRIYVMNADGSGVTALSPDGVEDTGPAWSPGGGKIAFVSQRDGDREIYVMDVDGQNVVNVTRHPADDWTPAWSPDGSRLIFSSIRAGNWEIFVMDTACLAAPETCPDNLVQLTADGTGNISPVWSPDGSRIAYTSKAAGNWDVYTMAVDGSDIRQVTTAPENDLSPAWSPDGTKIAFESNREGNVEIFVVDANGASPPQNVSNLAQANEHGPAWSPDGQQVVFYSNREGNWDVFSTTLDGQTVVNLTQTPNRDEQTPSWRP